ncbi:hypothetical protein V4F39_06875 [Aquincola sp. MAHUQ-54]|uniref:TAP-like protein n=1 Tax=Aquincola agrisoli TaxID=3119538 RepID=A0AAW9Q2P9_9BURK
MNLLPGLANLQCPVLVLAGDQDPVCPLEDAQDIAAALPRGVALRLRGGYRPGDLVRPMKRRRCCGISLWVSR